MNSSTFGNVLGLNSSTDQMLTDFTAVSFGSEKVKKFQNLDKKKIAENVLAAILGVVAFYLTTASVWYLVKHGKRKLIKTNILCTFAIATLLVRICAFELLLHAGNVSDDLCNAALMCSYICFCLSRFLPYVVLWIRQRAVYRNSTHAELDTRCAKIISGITIVGIIIFQPALTALQITYTRFVSSPYGCILKKQGEFFGFLKKASPIFFAASAVFQLTLLGLVLYPLKQHMKSIHLKQPGLKRLILRIAICTAVCITSDLIFLLAKHLKPPGNSSLLTGLLSCCDNTINVMAMLASFVDYGKRFFPVFSCRRQAHFNSLKTSRTSSSKKTET